MKLPERSAKERLVIQTDRQPYDFPYGEKSQRSTEQICFYYHYRHDRLDSGAALHYIKWAEYNPEIAGTGLYLAKASVYIREKK